MLRSFIAGLLIACTGAGIASAQNTMTFASAAPGPAPLNKAFVQWADKVAEATNGAVKINVVPGGTLGRNGQLLDRVAAGVVDIAWDFQGYYPNRFPKSSVAELPFMYESSIEGSTAFQALYDDGTIADEYSDFVVIGLFAFPNNSVISTDPLPSDMTLNGMKMSAQNPTMYAAAEALGAVPVSLGIGDWYPALSRGTIDGAVVAFTAVPAFRFQEVVSHYYKTSLGGNTAFAFMNRASFEALPLDARDQMMSVSGAVFAQHMGQFLDGQAAFGEKLASSTAKEIVTLDAEQSQKWRAALEPIKSGWIAKMADGANLVDAMNSAVAKARAE